ncbi:MAG: YicC family protein [Spirochaetales bacterium]|nr:YicC family protein [Spirochaetales bacterium]
MISMTGYGYHEIDNEEIRCTVEIKSYNNRYLDYNLFIPPFLSPLEPQIKTMLSESIKRGRVEFSIRIKELVEDIEVFIDEQALKAYGQTLKRCIEIADIPGTVTLDHILSMDGVLKTVKNRNIETLWEQILPAVQTALQQFVESRKREGDGTRADILRLLDSIRNGREFITGFAGEIEKRLNEDIKARYEQITGGPAGDDPRILTEIALLLVKYSINEELHRLDSHLDAFISACEENYPVGKKLDFLCQEINREINTIGSKSMVYEVNQKVVEMKDALENIREQLRNVE